MWLSYSSYNGTATRFLFFAIANTLYIYIYIYISIRWSVTPPPSRLSARVPVRQTAMSFDTAFIEP